jgi:hypothetical protein
LKKNITTVVAGIYIAGFTIISGVIADDDSSSKVSITLIMAAAAAKHPVA